MDARLLKMEAARAALAHVEADMVIGIGTGSTAEEFIRLLAAAVADGMPVTGVPTSERTAIMCRELGIPLTTLDDVPHLAMTVDGADEVDTQLRLIKGGGGALLREKIVAAASDSMIVIADETKLVDRLGRFPLPIEVNRFGLAATQMAVLKASEKLGLSGRIVLRMAEGTPFLTDGGHYILDASFGLIHDPRALSDALHAIPGVVEHGMFLDFADVAIIAGKSGVKTIKPTR